MTKVIIKRVYRVWQEENGSSPRSVGMRLWQRERQEGARVLDFLHFGAHTLYEAGHGNIQTGGGTWLTMSVAGVPGCTEGELPLCRRTLTPSLAQELGSRDRRWIEKPEAALLLLCFLHRESRSSYSPDWEKRSRWEEWLTCRGLILEQRGAAGQEAETESSSGNHLSAPAKGRWVYKTHSPIQEAEQMSSSEASTCENAEGNIRISPPFSPSAMGHTHLNAKGRRMWD